MLSVVTASLSLVGSPALAPSSNRACVRSLSMHASGDAVISRRDVFTNAAAVATAAALAPALPAMAESTLTTRQQAYTRYVPRIERGRDYWSGGLKKSIANQDWDAIARELEPVGKKGKGGAIPKVVGPMRLWASSFSSKTISDKTLAMNLALDELEESINSLSIAATGKEKDSGFLSFLGGKKTMDPAQRQKLAQLAFLKGQAAFNKYIEIGNDGLGLNFAPIDTID
jgi:hypothetical protein